MSAITQPQHVALVASNAVDGEDAPLERGTPGASARAEGERRAAAREAELRERHPRIGGFLHAITAEPQSTTAWFRGAAGEERVGRTLEKARPKGIEVLHDCSIPRSSANLDHLVVAPTGIWVVDAKRHADSRIERRDVGGWRGANHRLFVRGRDRTTLVEHVRRDAERIAVALASTPYAELPVHGALCFVGASIGTLQRPFRVSGVLVTWPSELVPPLLGRRREATPVAPDDIELIARHLAAAFPPRASALPDEA